MDYEAMTDEQLSEEWRKQYKCSMRSFIRQYGLHAGNFNQWTQGKRTSLASRSAVIKFLMENQGYAPVNVEETICYVDEDKHDEAINMIYTNSDYISDIVFVDGDQNTKARRIDLLLKAPESYIILYYHNSTTAMNISTKFKKPIPGFYMFNTYTDVGDSADTALTFDCGALNMILPRHISFHIISGDHFVQELQHHIRARRVYLYSHVDESTVGKLFGIHIPAEDTSLINENVVKLKEYMTNHNTVPIQHIYTVISPDEDWKSLLLRKEVQEYLGIKMVVHSMVERITA
jgi:hypothetical protein